VKCRQRMAEPTPGVLWRQYRHRRTRIFWDPDSAAGQRQTQTGRPLLDAWKAAYVPPVATESFTILFPTPKKRRIGELSRRMGSLTR
jgi:hypothetical protein